MGIHRGLHSVLALTLIALLAGCSKPKPRPSAPITPRPVSRSMVPLLHVGYAIQAGAFAKVENAARLAGQLQAQGMDATYQPTPAGLFRVRFGDFGSREAARQKAESLRTSGLIEAFWIVSPEEQPAARMALSDLPALRRSLVETARSFLGVPYLWGGSTEQGFDCSGLAMAVYQLNGLVLPRSSQGQADAGRVVASTDFQAGDLVFFSMSGNGRISHVGVYVGDGSFIHAPSKGGKVRVESLEATGFRGRIAGGRTYL
ncbi:MAG: NlpC/P60 family protein [Holophaga sp.]|nr:NlpC/P60 family protein [Holophaga sp.]